MKIKLSYFDYGREIDVCDIYRIDDKPVRLSMRLVKDRYELYARFYWISTPTKEIIIKRGSLEEVVETANALMLEHFGPDWEEYVIVTEEYPRSAADPRSPRWTSSPGPKH